MSDSLQRANKEIAEIYERHRMTVYRVCYAYMKNRMDTEDVVQETFFRLIRNNPVLKSAEHEKAWLIRTASNVCKDELKRRRRTEESLDDHPELQMPDMQPHADVLRAVTELPDKYKTVIYLYYYEGYDSAEIAAMLRLPKSTVRNRLHDARKLLKERLGADFDEE